MRRLVYISGAITNPDPCIMLENIQRFAAAENMLIRGGFAPINPAADWQAVSLGGCTYEMLMERDVALIRAVGVMDGALWMLDGWRNSEGALQEYHTARDCHLDCVEESEGVGRLHDIFGDDYGVSRAPGWEPD